MDAFDADVLIYAAVPDHVVGRLVRPLLESPPGAAGVGSVILLPEVLGKPLREGANEEVRQLAALLGRLTLLPADEETGSLAAALVAAYGLRAADAVHLATAVQAGAERFVTNNRKDFSRAIEEVDVTYPEDLPG